MKAIKQAATIISINLPNKNFEVKITDYPKDNFTLTLKDDEGDNVLLPLAKVNSVIILRLVMKLNVEK